MSVFYVHINTDTMVYEIKNLGKEGMVKMQWIWVSEILFPNVQ